MVQSLPHPPSVYTPQGLRTVRRVNLYEVRGVEDLLEELLTRGWAGPRGVQDGSPVTFK